MIRSRLQRKINTSTSAGAHSKKKEGGPKYAPGLDLSLDEHVETSRLRGLESILTTRPIQLST
jgi:hypothetical protein